MPEARSIAATRPVRQGPTMPEAAERRRGAASRKERPEQCRTAAPLPAHGLWRRRLPRRSPALRLPRLPLAGIAPVGEALPA